MPVIGLPPLHRAQVEVDSHLARNKVIVCGRRWGKTKLGVHKLVRASIENSNGLYWWVAPTFGNALEGWVTLKELTYQIPGCKVREADRCVIFPNKAETWIKSSDNPGGLRGRGLWGLVYDEFAYARESSWNLELGPSLADHQGWAWFISTPNGRNWGYSLWQSASLLPDWAAFRMPTSTNPYINPAWLAAEKIRMGDLEYRQEYEADFGASQYLVYQEFDKNIHMWKDKIPYFTQFFGGLDFGGTSIGSHKSTGVFAGRTRDDKLIILDEFEQSGPNIAERQMDWIRACENTVRIVRNKTANMGMGIHWRADKTQIVGIQMMRNQGLNIWPTKGGADSVSTGITMVQRRLKVREDGKATLFYLPNLHFVPEGFERYRYPEPNNDDQHQESKNPLKINDDMVDAIRYMVEGVDRMAIGDPQLLYKNQLAVLR